MKTGDLVQVSITSLTSKRYWLSYYNTTFKRFSLGSTLVNDGDMGVVVQPNPKNTGFEFLNELAYVDHVQVLVSNCVGWLPSEFLEVVS